MNSYLALMEWVSTDGDAWIAIPPNDSEVISVFHYLEWKSGQF